MEDDLAVAELLRALLNRVTGWGATVVHDAAAAREVFRHVEVEALVLDVNLPGISGVELLDLLRNDPHWGDPPVILTSANANQQEILDALERDPRIRFVAKPFDVDEVIAAVEEAVKGAVAAREAHAQMAQSAPVAA